ncbi:unnamed protein product [Polarella glacialis]|uniref:Uncharacterized protein n=1 Tax=Polarella glacialis TaxID=89957 RepID=A0A813KH38_POLGL|nr:unnamed protein product [Polarella glacialis]
MHTNANKKKNGGTHCELTTKVVKQIHCPSLLLLVTFTGMSSLWVAFAVSVSPPWKRGQGRSWLWFVSQWLDVELFFARRGSVEAQQHSSLGFVGEVYGKIDLQALAEFRINQYPSSR